MNTLTLNEQLTNVWEIKQLTLDIRHLANKVEENRQDIADRPNSELNAQRESLISKQLNLIEEKKQLIKKYASEL